MPIRIEIEADTSLAIVHCSGTLGIEDARTGASALWKHPGYPFRAVVWEFREARFSLVAEEVREMGKFILDRQPDPPPEKVAFVTPRDVDFGMARMFGVFRDEERTLFRVFRDLPDALEWARRSERPAPG